MDLRWRWQPLGAAYPSARTSDSLSSGWPQPHSSRSSEGREAGLRDLRWRRAKGPANVHWAGILWAYHVGRRLQPCEVWMSKALASSPWLVVLRYLDTKTETGARELHLPEAVGLRVLARAGRWQASLGFLKDHLASFQVALAQSIAETGQLAVAIRLAYAAAAEAAEDGSMPALRRPLRQLCSTCFESRWPSGLGLLRELRRLRLTGEVVFPAASRAMNDSNWREALALLGVFEDVRLRPTVKSFAHLAHAGGPWVLSLALVQSQSAQGQGLSGYDRAQGLRWRSWRDPLQHLSQLKPPNALASVAGMRSLCDGFHLKATWQRAMMIFSQHFPRFGSADAYVCCEALRVCVSGAAWTLSLRLLDTLSRKKRIGMIGMRRSRFLKSQSLAFTLTIRACSWPRQWTAVLTLLGEVLLRRLECHVGMYDAGLFSLVLVQKKGTTAGAGSTAFRRWFWAASLLQKAREQSLRRNPFMLQATIRSAFGGGKNWAVCLELLSESLRNSLEAHWNHFAAAADGLAWSPNSRRCQRRWDWACWLLSEHLAEKQSLEAHRGDEEKQLRQLAARTRRGLRSISRAWQLSAGPLERERERASVRERCGKHGEGHLVQLGPT
ncbi:RPL23B [Symbiodinium sp. CCMP2592]|nr:RPL23B [Symbiodinium sp. CCMP2592]